MTWSNYVGAGVNVRLSPAESARFGHAVVRVDIGRCPVTEVADALAGTDGDVLIVRFDARRRDIAAILAADGRAVLPAGTLTYWEREVNTPAGNQVDPGLAVAAIEDMGPAGREVVESIVRDSFAAYPNHYAVNTLFAADLAEAGYVEWALSRLTDETGHVLVLSESEKPIGVATMSDKGSDLEIELAGLIADAQGRGAYGELLTGCVVLAGNLGKQRVIISTQADNVRVQRAWVRSGFKPFAAVETVHLVTRAG